MKILAVLFLLGAFVSNCQGYFLREYELDDLDVFVKYYVVKAIEVDVNTTFETFQSLALECATMVNATADACTACVQGTNCNQGGGNQIDQILGAVEANANKLFNNIGKMSSNLLNNVGGSIKGLLGNSFDDIKNTFNGISNINLGVSGLSSQFQGLKAIFDGFLSGTENLLKSGLESTKSALNSLKNSISNTLNDIKNAFSKIPSIFKRSAEARRVRRALDQCVLDACPDCLKINLPENPTEEQLAAVMANICQDKYTAQVEAQANVEKLINLVGQLSNSTSRIIDSVDVNYDRATREETLQELTMIIQGVTISHTQTTKMVVDTRDLQSMGEQLAPMVYNKLKSA